MHLRDHVTQTRFNDHQASGEGAVLVHELEDADKVAFGECTGNHMFPQV